MKQPNEMNLREVREAIAMVQANLSALKPEHVPSWRQMLVRLRERERRLEWTCPHCHSTQVEVVDRYGRYAQVECKLCDFAWTEE